MNAADPRPLIAHVLHRFDTGGLENGVVNLINRMPAESFRHAVIAVTEVTEFRRRLERDDVACIALMKGPGHGARIYPRLWRLLRQLRPAIVHTRNLAALEMQPVAWAAGVPGRIHGEHGRDVEDLHGTSVRHQRIRRLYSPFVQRYVALSKDLERYLVQRVGIDRSRIEQIYNGVDAERFRPRLDMQAPRALLPFEGRDAVVFGTVGRMQTVKHPDLLARAFVQLVRQHPGLRERARLVMIGDGALRTQVTKTLESAGLLPLAWLPGERTDVPALMQEMDVFVLPSLAEGISNTILEAMACGLPVVATAVGGNAELVVDGRTGRIVPSDDLATMVDAMRMLAEDQTTRRRMGAAARADVVQRFSLQAMVQAYQALYEQALSTGRGSR